jgi:quercetin dioxygenase-like cupin family protein
LLETVLLYAASPCRGAKCQLHQPVCPFAGFIYGTRHYRQYFYNINIKIMKNRTNFTMGAMLFLGLATFFIPESVCAQAPGIKRTDLQRHDLSTPGREMIQVRVDIAPGVLAPNHSHPGEEIIYVLEGTFVYEVEGEAPKTLKAGDVLFIPAGKVHSAKNIGTTNAAELATYIVEKGKPLVVLKK